MGLRGTWVHYNQKTPSRAAVSMPTHNSRSQQVATAKPAFAVGHTRYACSLLRCDQNPSQHVATAKPAFAVGDAKFARSLLRCDQMNLGSSKAKNCLSPG